jgi:hypothetical protein
MTSAAEINGSTSRADDAVVTSAPACVKISRKAISNPGVFVNEDDV